MALTTADRTPLTPDQRNSFIAALLGWTMDAFDYFIVVLVYADIAKDVRRLADADGVPHHGHPADAPGRRADLRRCGPTGSAGASR